MDIEHLRQFFDDMLCRAYFRSRFPRDNPRSISVTEITQCLRLSYFSRIDPRCVPQVTALLLGIQGHRIFQDSLAEYGFLTEKLVCVERDGIRLCGRIDAYHPDLGLVVDFKFVERPPDEVYDDHRFQVSVYMNMIDAGLGAVVYFSRDPERRTKVFYVHRRRSDLDRALERAKILSEHLINGTPPPREPGRWCRWCPYRFDCYKAERKVKNA